MLVYMSNCKWWSACVKSSFCCCCCCCMSNINIYNKNCYYHHQFLNSFFSMKCNNWRIISKLPVSTFVGRMDISFIFHAHSVAERQTKCCAFDTLNLNVKSILFFTIPYVLFKHSKNELSQKQVLRVYPEGFFKPFLN